MQWVSADMPNHIEALRNVGVLGHLAIQYMHQIVDALDALNSPEKRNQS